VVKSEWGLKRACLSCSAKFYDLQKTTITCPSCGTILEVISATKSRKTKTEKTKIIDVEDDLIDEDIDDVEDEI